MHVMRRNRQFSANSQLWPVAGKHSWRLVPKGVFQIPWRRSTQFKRCVQISQDVFCIVLPSCADICWYILSSFNCSSPTAGCLCSSSRARVPVLCATSNALTECKSWSSGACRGLLQSTKTSCRDGDGDGDMMLCWWWCYWWWHLMTLMMSRMPHVYKAK